MWGGLADVKRESYIPGLGLQLVVAGNRTWVPCKNSQRSTSVLSLQPLGVISAPGVSGPVEQLLLSVMCSTVSSTVCGALRIYSGPALPGIPASVPIASSNAGTTLLALEFLQSCFGPCHHYGG